MPRIKMVFLIREDPLHPCKSVSDSESRLEQGAYGTSMTGAGLQLHLRWPGSSGAWFTVLPPGCDQLRGCIAS